MKEHTVFDYFNAGTGTWVKAIIYLVVVGKDGPHCLKKGDGTEFL